MSKIVFTLDEELVVTAPVNIRIPKSVRVGAAAPKQEFITRTAFVDVRVPPEDDLEAVQDRIRQHNDGLVQRLTDAERARIAAVDDEARLAADAEIAAIRKDIRDSMIEQLKEFIVGLPDGHGFAEAGGKPAVYSPDLIERLCNYRHVRLALWDAFTTLINGDPKRGN